MSRNYDFTRRICIEAHEGRSGPYEVSLWVEFFQRLCCGQADCCCGQYDCTSIALAEFVATDCVQVVPGTVRILGKFVQVPPNSYAYKVTVKDKHGNVLGWRTSVTDNFQVGDLIRPIFQITVEDPEEPIEVSAAIEVDNLG